ncbi:MAG: hypothetical protein ACJA2H_000643 [Nitriliruptoraceae bacterium]|jgi:hypothetical protein
MLILLRGVVVAGIAALAIAVPSLIGLSSPWPILLVAAVAFARPAHPGAAGALLLGACAWWLGMALRAGVLPDALWSEVVAATVAVAVCVLAAMVSSERLPLFAGLAGLAAFAGLYEPVFAAEPTQFLSASPLAFGAVVVATGLGFLAASLVDVVARASERDQFASLHTEAVS